ncbi:hypothetical protein [Pseudomonas protegens]|uniref:hypothetical protein n=1 Tax=Pseudomonas protegens TaxID=380021 RepID=UPI001616C5A1|nr:hypothetical protein [Pseudomonas protegens]
MNKSTDVEELSKRPAAPGEQVAVSLVYRDVPKEKRKQLETIAKEFAKKHRKLVNYIEK